MTESHSNTARETKPHILIVAGPTASGKSACAVAVAREFDGVVINADSMQVYQELHVVTARPSAREEAMAPHRLYGVMSVKDACSTGRWLEMATHEIEVAWAQGRLPILCGGTGLYLKALMEGIAPIPDIPQEVRDDARRRHAELGGEAFRQMLVDLDPEAARRLPPGDSQRLIRAYEIVMATGRTQAEWLKEEPVRAVDARFATIALISDRAQLYPSIDARFNAMMEMGALEEVRAMNALGLDPALPACKAVGVRELLGHLRGEMTLNEAIVAAQQASRNYAKRQMTWLRTQLESENQALCHINEQYSERLSAKIFSFVRQFLLT